MRRLEGRKNLEAAELVYVTHRRKVLYEIKYPDAAKPGPKENCRNYCDNSAAPADRYTKAAAQYTGKSERAIQMAARIGKHQPFPE